MCGIQDYQEVSDQWEEYQADREQENLAYVYEEVIGNSKSAIETLEETLDEIEKLQSDDLEEAFDKIAQAIDLLEDVYTEIENAS